MRKESASIVALAVFGLAEELKPNDVPLACANICGPVVELSVLCDIDGTTQVQELKRRKLAHVPRAAPTNKKAKRQVVPPQTSAPPATRSIGQFKTIPFGTPAPSAAPTTPPTVAQPVEVLPNIEAGLVDGSAPIINLRPSYTPTVINPLIPGLLAPSTPPQSRLPTSTPTPSLAPVSSSTVPVFSSTVPAGGAGGANLPVGNGGVVRPTRDAGDGTVDMGDDMPSGMQGDVTDDVGSIRDGAGMLWPGQKQKQDEANRERQCFCSNKSFDVARVAGLCASCITQMGDDKSPIDSIVSMCNITVEQYEPSLDSVAVGVKVRMTSSAARERSAATLLAVGVALGLAGLAEVLW